MDTLWLNRGASLWMTLAMFVISFAWAQEVSDELLAKFENDDE